MVVARIVCLRQQAQRSKRPLVCPAGFSFNAKRAPFCAESCSLVRTALFCLLAREFRTRRATTRASQLYLVDRSSFDSDRADLSGFPALADYRAALQSPRCADVHDRERAPLQFHRGFFPVSYTHLRAHETGRNLVCRLLL